MAADMQNEYLNAQCGENNWTTCRMEFGPDAGKEGALIIEAFYGQKRTTSQHLHGVHNSPNLWALEWVSTRGDPDVWIRLSTMDGGEKCMNTNWSTSMTCWQFNCYQCSSWSQNDSCCDFNCKFTGRLSWFIITDSICGSSTTLLTVVTKEVAIDLSMCVYSWCSNIIHLRPHFTFESNSKSKSKSRSTGRSQHSCQTLKNDKYRTLWLFADPLQPDLSQCRRQRGCDRTSIEPRP